jgi:hypothetical protein
VSKGKGTKEGGDEPDSSASAAAFAASSCWWKAAICSGVGRPSRAASYSAARTEKDEDVSISLKKRKGERRGRRLVQTYASPCKAFLAAVPQTDCTPHRSTNSFPGISTSPFGRKDQAVLAPLLLLQLLLARSVPVDRERRICGVRGGLRRLRERRRGQ